MSAMAVRQGTPEWLAARRQLVTATDLPVILGLSPWKSEADLAAEKLGAEPGEPSLPMRLGLALEPLIREEYERQTGSKLRRFHGLSIHPEIEWAAASPDYGVVGERRLVEAKWTTSRTRFADGLPQDIEAQITWQCGVLGYPAAHAAVLVAGTDFQIIDVPFDPQTFANLVVVAEDFRRRLAAGGPFAESASSVKRRYPADNGAEMVADQDIAEAVRTLVALRARKAALVEDEERLETSIKTRMGEFALLRGPDFRVTWKRTKDSEITDWKSLAASLLRLVPETDRDAVVGLHTTVRQGFRPFRVVMEGKDE